MIHIDPVIIRINPVNMFGLISDKPEEFIMYKPEECIMYKPEEFIMYKPEECIMYKHGPSG